MCDIIQSETILSNFTNLTQYSSTFCAQINSLDVISTRYLLNIMLIPVLILILVTLFGKNDEDSKWFVFHTAVLNLVLGIIWEIVLYFPDFQSQTITMVFINFSMNLAANSILPLAFTRFLVFYFPFYYEKLFTKKTLLPWMVGYDLAFIGLQILDSYIGSHGIILTLCLGTFLFNLICSISILIKLRKMMKLMENNSNNNTFSDLRRAALICIFQSGVLSLNVVTLFFEHLFLTFLIKIIEDFELMEILVTLYLSIVQLKYPLYQFCVIIDTTVTLLVLRSYRNVLKKIWMNIKRVRKDKLANHAIHIRHFTNNYMPK